MSAAPPRLARPEPAAGADLLLAFDTSTERLAVGLSRGAEAWTRDLPGGAAASATLLPTVHALLAEAGAELTDVAAIAFGRGPGAFTGLRTSCAVAQGLAFGLKRPVLPLDSLLIVAEQARAQAAGATGFEVGVVMDARMGEVYAGRYRFEASGWAALQAPALWAPADLAAHWAAAPPPVTAGSALIPMADALQPACAPERQCAVGEERASALLALARQAWAAGVGTDAAEALPLYLRDKVALTTAERMAVRRAAAGAVPSAAAT